MKDKFCERCGEYLPEGTIKYSIHIQILSDFDGVILYEEDNTIEETQKFFCESDDMDDNYLEDDIFQEVSFILCANCKTKFARDPFNRGAGFFKANKNIERLFN